MTKRGEVRIIGGQWRSRKLTVLDAVGLRPTSDRIRETLFNWLAPKISGARCLDCFAGSGALGFEALSRYAGYVLMLERAPEIVKQLQQNCRLFGTTAAEIIKTDSLEFLENFGNPFDVVFVDPPFNEKMLEKTLFLLETHNWLASDAWVYVESEVSNTTFCAPSHWYLYREKKTKQAYSRIYQRNQQEI